MQLHSRVDAHVAVAAAMAETCYHAVMCRQSYKPYVAQMSKEGEQDRQQLCSCTGI
jgi:hypothetical protein